jgi:NhaC family Na+:H+ antiporter
VISLIGFLFTGLVLLGTQPHIPLILATAVTAIVAAAYNRSWQSIQEGMVHGIQLAMASVLILLIVGIMIGTWILGGIVPAMIYYGLQLLSPAIFLAATLIICSIVALGTGSSWSTAGTVGVALMGVGAGLGIPLPLVGGAIISGAYFGDKMSPLSDTTNLAPAVAGTDLFSHIRHMLSTTGPAYLITIILYSVIGLRFQGAIESTHIDTMLKTLEEAFYIHPLLLLPPLLVILMVILKIPALPALFGGACLGAVFAFIFQGSTLQLVFESAYSGYVSLTQVEAVDTLLTRGGLSSMMDTVALILCALSFGGVMEKSGMLECLASALLRRVNRSGSLIATTLVSSIIMNGVAPNQYMSIVIPGRMMRGAYVKMGLHPKNLSRCLEDAGTLSSPLIPYNSCGAFMAATLGISTLAYLPFAFFNLITPFISLVYGLTGFTIARAEKMK